VSRAAYARPTAPAWADSPLFSRTLAGSLGLHTPWEQLGLCGTVLGGCTYGLRQFHRAHHVAKYAQTENVKHLYEANVPVSEAPRALYLVNKIRARGALAALGAPMLWLAWRTSHVGYDTSAADWRRQSA
jgi:hypothetical protein